MSSIDDQQPDSHETVEDPVAITDKIQAATATGTAMAGSYRPDESSGNDESVTSTIEVGADVIGTCGHKVGEVVAVREEDVVVEKGFFMPVDFYIPKSAIKHNNEHGLYLNVTKDEALHHGWDVDPLQARRAS